MNCKDDSESHLPFPGGPRRLLFPTAWIKVGLTVSFEDIKFYCEKFTCLWGKNDVFIWNVDRCTAGTLELGECG